MLSFALAGLSVGSSYALIGLTLTITYLSTRSVNFAAAGTGAFGAFVLALTTQSGLPYALGLLLGILTGALIGVGIGWVLAKWFSESTVITRSVITLTLLVSMMALASLIFAGDTQAVPSRFLDPAFTVAGTPIDQASVIMLVLDVLLVVGVGAMLTRTTLGKRLQAVAERPKTAELLGIRSQRYGLWVWTASGALSVVAVTLIASTQSTDFGTLGLLVIPGLAASLAGLFKSLPWTLVGGLAIGAVQGMAAGTAMVSQYAEAVPFVAILFVLIYTQRNQRFEDAR